MIRGGGTNVSRYIQSVWAMNKKSLGDSIESYMVINRLEHLLGRDQQGSHFPNGHLKVHLGELEHSN